jgi:hypothetical protein
MTYSGFRDSTMDAARLGQFGIIPNQGGDSTTRAAQRGRVLAEVVDQNIVVDPVKGTVTEIPPSKSVKKINTGKVGGGRFQSYRYPNKMLTSTTDYLKIKIVKYIPMNQGKKSGDKSAGGEGKSSTKKSFMKTLGGGFSMETVSSRVKKQSPLAQVLLPIPQSITDSNGVSWGDSTLNPIEALGYAAGSSLMQGDISALPNIDGFGTIDESTKQAVMSALASAAIGKGAGEMVSRSTGQVMNPNLEVIFNGVQTRSFGFAFAFSPRNMSEANQVKQIIRLFKQHSAAKGSSGNGFFIASPDIFIFEYMKGGGAHPFLNVFKPMVINSIAMDYTGNGTYSTFHDGTPSLMKMTLNLQELNPIYAEHYESGEGTRGVGF